MSRRSRPTKCPRTPCPTRWNTPIQNRSNDSITELPTNGSRTGCRGTIARDCRVAHRFRRRPRQPMPKEHRLPGPPCDLQRGLSDGRRLGARSDLGDSAWQGARQATLACRSPAVGHLVRRADSAANLRKHGTGCQPEDTAQAVGTLRSGTRRTREPRGPGPWGDRTTSRRHSPGRRARAPSGRAWRSTARVRQRHRRPRGRHGGRGSTRPIDSWYRASSQSAWARAACAAPPAPAATRLIESGQRRGRSSVLDQQAAAQRLQPRVAGGESEARLDVGHGARSGRPRGGGPWRGAATPRPRGGAGRPPGRLPPVPRHDFRGRSRAPRGSSCAESSHGCTAPRLGVFEQISQFFGGSLQVGRERTTARGEAIQVIGVERGQFRFATRGNGETKSGPQPAGRRGEPDRFVGVARGRRSFVCRASRASARAASHSARTVALSVSCRGLFEQARQVGFGDVGPAGPECEAGHGRAAPPNRWRSSPSSRS